MSLIVDELKFLKLIGDRLNGGDPVMARLPLSPRIQGLIDRGYLRTVNLVVGPLKVPAEGPGLRFTEAGRKVFDSIYVQEPRPCPPVPDPDPGAPSCG